jgi:hypothetical protein
VAARLRKPARLTDTVTEPRERFAKAHVGLLVRQFRVNRAQELRERRTKRPACDLDTPRAHDEPCKIFPSKHPVLEPDKAHQKRFGLVGRTCRARSYALKEFGQLGLDRFDVAKCANGGHERNNLAVFGIGVSMDERHRIGVAPRHEIGPRSNLFERLPELAAAARG